MIWLVFISCAAAIACAIGWRRTLRELRFVRQDHIRMSKAYQDDAWMHGSCLSIAEGRVCSEDDAAVKASLATRTVFALRKQHDAQVVELAASRANADRLAASLREYVRQMDEYAMKLGDPPCALSREREALSQHQKLKESQQCPPSPS